MMNSELWKKQLWINNMSNTEENIIREIAQLVAEETLGDTEPKKIIFSDNCISISIQDSKVVHLVNQTLLEQTLQESLKHY